MLFLPLQSVPLKSTLNPTADRDSFKSQAAKFHLSQQSESGKPDQIQMGSIFMMLLKNAAENPVILNSGWSIALVFALGYATNHERLPNMAIIAGE